MTTRVADLVSNKLPSLNELSVRTTLTGWLIPELTSLTILPLVPLVPSGKFSPTLVTKGVPPEEILMPFCPSVFRLFIWMLAKTFASDGNCSGLSSSVPTARNKPDAFTSRFLASRRPTIISPLSAYNVTLPARISFVTISPVAIGRFWIALLSLTSFTTPLSILTPFASALRLPSVPVKSAGSKGGVNALASAEILLALPGKAIGTSRLRTLFALLIFTYWPLWTVEIDISPPEVLIFPVTITVPPTNVTLFPNLIDAGDLNESNVAALKMLPGVFVKAKPSGVPVNPA